MGKEIKTLGDIAELIKTGKTPPSKEADYYNGIINWYTPGDLDKVKYLNTSTRTITKKALDDGKATLLPKHTVLIGCIGDIGKVGITSMPACSNQQITGIKPIDTVNHEYLFYYIKSIKNLLQSKSNNAVVPIINNRELKKISIPLPPLSEQERIAGVLSKAEGLIDLRRQSLQALDDLLKSVFLEMFGDPVKNEKGWEVKELGEVSKIKIGPFGSLLHKEDYVPNGIPLVNPSHIINDRIVVDANLSINPQKVKELSSYLMKDGDIVIGRRGEIGRCTVVRKAENGYLCGTGSMFVRLNPNEIAPMFLNHFIKTSRITSFLDGVAKGATMKNINTKIIGNLQIPLPPLSLQQQFAGIVEQVELLRGQYELSLLELEALYGSLSQEAFRG